MLFFATFQEIQTPFFAPFQEIQTLFFAPFQEIRFCINKKQAINKCSMTHLVPVLLLAKLKPFIPFNLCHIFQ